MDGGARGMEQQEAVGASPHQPGVLAGRCWEQPWALDLTPLPCDPPAGLCLAPV